MKLQEGNVSQFSLSFCPQGISLGDPYPYPYPYCWNLLTWRPCPPPPNPRSQPCSRPPFSHFRGSPRIQPQSHTSPHHRGTPYPRPFPSDIFKLGTSWKAGNWNSTERHSCFWIKESSMKGNRSCVWHSWSKNKHNPCAAVVLCEYNRCLYCFHGLFHKLLYSTAYEQFSLHCFISAKKTCERVQLVSGVFVIVPIDTIIHSFNTLWHMFHTLDILGPCPFSKKYVFPSTVLTSVLTLSQLKKSCFKTTHIYFHYGTFLNVSYIRVQLIQVWILYSLK